MKNIAYLVLTMAILALTACSGTKKVSQDLSKNTRPETVIAAKADNGTTETVIDATKAMFQSTADKDFETMLNYMHPGVFEIVSRDIMKTVLEEAMNDEDMEAISMKFLDIKEKSAIVHKDTEYKLMSYSMKIIMDVEKSKENAPIQGDFDGTDFLLGMLKEQYGADTVVFHKAENAIHVSLEKDMYAANVADDGWKFIQKEDAQMSLIKEIIPEPVLNKLK